MHMIKFDNIWEKKNFPITYSEGVKISQKGGKYRKDIFTPGWRYRGGENIVSHRPSM